jgi:hypothetical protein
MFNGCMVIFTLSYLIHLFWLLIQYVSVIHDHFTPSPPLWLGCFFSSLILYTVGRTPWTGNQPVARLLPIHRTTQTHNKRKQISMPRMGFEPTIPVFEHAKTVHALDRAATVVGIWSFSVRLYVLHILNLINQTVEDTVHVLSHIRCT